MTWWITDTSIGQRLKFVRRFRRLTQKELGLRMGYSEKTADIRIAQYEKNARTPNAETTAKFAEVLKVSPAVFSPTICASLEDLLQSMYWLFLMKGGGDIYDCETEYAKSRMEQKLGVITVEEFLEKILANYVVRSHMSDKAYKKAHEKVSEEVKKLAHSSDDNAQFMQLQKYNSVVAGLHEYYCISTEVSHDFSRLAFSINKQLRNRLKGDLSKKGQLRNGFIKEKYGASRQMRFLHGRPVVPLGYVQSKNAQHKRKSINKYTVKGREQIHKNLAIDTATMLWLMRNPVKGRTIEYVDNRISLYAAQYGKCAVTGIPMDSHDIHCHHKVPVSNGGSDEYANLILVSKAVHILIHASSEPTIEKYLKSLNLDNKQIEKLNKLRSMAEMPPIIL